MTTISDYPADVQEILIFMRDKNFSAAYIKIMIAIQKSSKIYIKPWKYIPIKMSEFHITFCQTYSIPLWAKLKHPRHQIS
jgi:hypothetical protein